MAFIATQSRHSTSAPGDGSRTVTITNASARPEDAETSNNPDGTLGVLRLRGGPRSRQRVAWDEDVVDNEGCGKKSSKICCIYHKPRKFDESSSEESSDSDSDCDNRHQHRHSHGRRPSPGGDRLARPQTRPDEPATVHQLEDNEDRNAYEIVPSSKKGKRKVSQDIYPQKLGTDVNSTTDTHQDPNIHLMSVGTFLGAMDDIHLSILHSDQYLMANPPMLGYCQSHRGTPSGALHRLPTEMRHEFRV